MFLRVNHNSLHVAILIDYAFFIQSLGCLSHSTVVECVTIKQRDVIEHSLNINEFPVVHKVYDLVNGVFLNRAETALILLSQSWAGVVPVAVL